MKIIVSKSELEVIQKFVSEIIDKVNEIDPEAEVEKANLMDALAELKDEVYVKYKILSGEFVINISEEFFADVMAIYGNATVKMLPVFYAMKPIIEMMNPIVRDIKVDLISFNEKYSAFPGASSKEGEVA